MINEGNVAHQAEILLDQFRKKAQLYGGKNNHDLIMVPHGGDSRYETTQEARNQFENLNRLAKYMNSNTSMNVEVKFGTLRSYFELLKQKNKKNGKQFKTLTGDFFTHADKEDQYWSGFYSSKPFYKRLDRMVEHYLRSAEISYSLNYFMEYDMSNSTIELYKKLIVARKNLALFQHHHGITGTSRSRVVTDYADKYAMCTVLNLFVQLY
jgi:alpha-mannosidase II